MKNFYINLAIIVVAAVLSGVIMYTDQKVHAGDYLPYYDDALVQNLTVTGRLTNQGRMQLLTVDNATLGASEYDQSADNGTMYFCSDCAAGQPGLVYGNGTSWMAVNGTSPFVPRTTSS